MSEEKHPSWFKMKIERRELIQQLAPETAVNVLLACWEYLETNERPRDLSPIEKVAFASFMPDMEEAWTRYLQRINARKQGEQSDDIERHRTRQKKNQNQKKNKKKIQVQDSMCMTDKPSTRFIPPTVDEVAAYIKERNSHVDPETFVDFYTSKGWMVGKNRMKDWRAACRRWETGGTVNRDRDAIKTVEDYDSGDSFV